MGGGVWEAWRSVGGYHLEWDKYPNEEVNLQDRFGGIALVTYKARQWVTKVGDDGGRRRWATRSKETNQIYMRARWRLRQKAASPGVRVKEQRASHALRRILQSPTQFEKVGN